MVRFRQLADLVRHRLLFVPLLFVFGAIVLSQAMLTLDEQFDNGSLPRTLETTVDSGGSILSSIAGGLISAVTLLLSLMLVTVQLASSQFSPRTLRNWLGDRTLQVTIGLTLGTTVYCLLILRATKTFKDGATLTPSLSVILAVVLGVGSLIAVVRSVDHLTDRLRVGSVADRLMTETIGLIEHHERLGGMAAPPGSPVLPQVDVDAPDDALIIEARKSGWIQQVSDDAILRATPDGATTNVVATVGAFVLERAPLAWVWPAPPDRESCEDKVHSAIAIGDTRTMQQDIGFGILQLVDIALRALSPGVNDPNTAKDIVVHLGPVMLALWEREMPDSTRQDHDSTVYRRHLEHGDYLHASYDQIRRYGSGDAEVAATVITALQSLRAEVVRRSLPGPLEPIDEVVSEMLAAVERSDLMGGDKAAIRSLVGDTAP